MEHGRRTATQILRTEARPRDLARSVFVGDGCGGLTESWVEWGRPGSGVGGAM